MAQAQVRLEQWPVLHPNHVVPGDVRNDVVQAESALLVTRPASLSAAA